MKQIIDRYLDTRYKYSKRTKSAYKCDLYLFANYLGDKKLNLITTDDINNFIIHLRDNGNSQITLARKISSLKSFFKYLSINNLINSNPAENIESPKINRAIPHYLTDEEVENLKVTTWKEAGVFYKERDYAIVQVFLSTGLRIAELSSLKMDDVDLNNNKIKITRKGGKEQYIPINPQAREAIKAYIKKRPQINCDGFFISKRNKETEQGYNISPGNIHYLIKKYMKKANINIKKLSCHSLRHTFATSLYRNGVDLLVIQKLLGHANISSTQIYTHVRDEDLVNAVNKLTI